MKDRPGHDRSYATDSTKPQTELGWKPVHTDFQKDIEQTIAWYTKPCVVGAGQGCDQDKAQDQ